MEKISVMLVMEEEAKIKEFENMLTNIDYLKLISSLIPDEDLMFKILDTQPDVVIMGANILGDGYKVVEELTAENPDIATILIEKEFKEETIRKAVFSGAKDILIYPVDSPLLLNSIYRTYQKEKKRMHQQRSNPTGVSRKKVDGNIITVFSNKGGVGKTFIATNLAASLALGSDKRVALVDFDLDYGNVGLALNLVSHFTISDVINEIRNLDREMMEGYMIPHSSGMLVLAAPAEARLNEFINSDHIETILKTLRTSFDYIVVDMPCRLKDNLEPVFRESDQLILVVDQNLSTIQNVKAFAGELEALNYPKNKLKLLLNSYDRKKEIALKDIETTLKLGISIAIPYDYKLVSGALNRGLPVELFGPRSKVAKSITLLSSLVREGEEDKEFKNNKNRQKTKQENANR